MLDTVLTKLRKLDPASIVAIAIFAEERLRQIEGEGYSPIHDQEHSVDEMVQAGIAYGMASCGRPKAGLDDWWPWTAAGFRPDPAKDLRRFGGMAIAAMARKVRPSFSETDAAASR